MSTVRSCRLAQFTRAAWYRRSTARDQSALALRIRDIAHARPRFGYQRITVMLRREGWPVNRKRVRRLYRLQGLQVRMRVRRRKHMCLQRGPVPLATRTHERWSMDRGGSIQAIRYAKSGFGNVPWINQDLRTRASVADGVSP